MESDCILIDDVARRNQNISFSRFFFLLLLTNHLRKRLRHDSSAQNIKSHSIIRFFFCDNLFNLQVFGRELRILPLAKCGYRRINALDTEIRLGNCVLLLNRCYYFSATHLRPNASCITSVCVVFVPRVARRCCVFSTPDYITLVPH